MTPRAFLWRVLAFLLARYELIPAPDGSPYLSRWHFPRWLARRFGARYLFLHRFHQSDPDRGWHNHPWEWCESQLLAGAYVQEIRARIAIATRPKHWLIQWRTFYEVFEAGECNRLDASQFHSVHLRTPVMWTLFRAGSKHGHSWGFIDEQGEFTPANGMKH